MIYLDHGATFIFDDLDTHVLGGLAAEQPLYQSPTIILIEPIGLGKTFPGSMDEMEGNKARVGIFLQPVNPAKEGQVSTLKQSKWSFSPFSFLLILGTLLVVGMFGFVLFTIRSNMNSGPESTTVSANVDPTTMLSTTTTTTTMSTTTMTTSTTTMTTTNTPKTTTDITIPTAATTISSRQITSI